jgi:hypothetical protein
MVGDYIAIDTSVPTEIGAAPVTHVLPVARVTSVVGTAVTCEWKIDRDYPAAAPGTIYGYSQEWAPGGTATATTTSGNADLTACTAGLLNAVKVGDWIKGAGIQGLARITVINSGASTITMSKTATASATGVSVYYARLTAL